MATASSASGAPVVVLDNGGHTVKIGLAGSARPAKVVLNCAMKPKREKRVYLADQIQDIIDFSAVFYRTPVDKGYVVNWDLQRQLWDRVFGPHGLRVKFEEAALLVTEPLFNPPALRREMDEVVFERYGFQRYGRVPSSRLAPIGFCKEVADGERVLCSRVAAAGGAEEEPSTAAVYSPAISLVIDSGYSFTHAVPVIDGLPFLPAVRRLNIGGKHLTNLLKETVSYRAWNVMEETHLINHVKESLCFVSTDFSRDLELSHRARSPIRREYVLPTGSSDPLGYAKPTAPGPAAAYTFSAAKGEPRPAPAEDAQTLSMNNERFAIPEALFSPADIGWTQGGVAEIALEAVRACPPAYRGMLLANVLLVGGSSGLPQFCDRLQELRQTAPDEAEVGVFQSAAPQLTSWVGGSVLGADKQFEEVSITRAEYKEHGPDSAFIRSRLPPYTDE